jgi:hypothetical protein
MPMKRLLLQQCHHGIPEPKCLVSYAGMIPIRFSGSRIKAISASDISSLAPRQAEIIVARHNGLRMSFSRCISSSHFTKPYPCVTAAIQGTLRLTFKLTPKASVLVLSSASLKGNTACVLTSNHFTPSSWRVLSARWLVTAWLNRRRGQGQALAQQHMAKAWTWTNTIQPRCKPA